MQHSIMNTLTPDLTHKILNDPSLQSKQDVQNIREVSRSFRDCKVVPKWQIRTNVPPNIFMSAGNRSCSELDLCGCDLKDVTVPLSLSPSLKHLDLSNAYHIPADLIPRALQSDLITLDLIECDLEDVTMPGSLSQSLQKLDLSNATHIPAELITKALESDL